MKRPTVEEMKAFFDKEINPVLAEHSGGCNILRIESDKLFISMYGKCLGCMDADNTVSDFIEKEVVKAFPKIKKVILEDPVADEMLAFAKTLMGRHKP